MKSFVVICILLYGFISEAHGDDEQPCEFPPGFVGQWLTSIWGHVTVTNTSIILTEGDLGLGNDLNQLNCYMAGEGETEGNYVLQSNGFEAVNLAFTVKTCVDIRRINSDHYQVDILTSRTGSENIPAVTVLDGTEITLDNTCEDFVVLNGEFVRQGSEQGAGMDCPSDLQGQFDVTYSGNAGVLCPSGATMTTCDQPTALAISNDGCPESLEGLMPEYEAFLCLSDSLMGSDKITVLKNETDDTSAAAFACLSMSQESDGIQLNRTSNGCSGTWVETEEVTQETFTVNSTGPCPSEVTTTETPNVTANVTGADDSFNTTTSSPDVNSTETGGNSTDDYDNSTTGDADAATSMMTNSFLLPSLMACVGVVLANWFNWQM